MPVSQIFIILRCQINIEMTDLLKQLIAEEKLLLFLCRLEFTYEQKEEISILIKEIKDWDYFVRLANEHGIIALVSYNIHEVGLAEMIPSAQMKRLDNGRMQSMVRNAWLTERWKEVNTILTGAGIKHILLKGMALEHTVYGARGLRQMNDADILVKKGYVMKAWLLLQEHGFESDMIKSALHRKIITENGKHMPTLRKEGYPVEIHHRLFYDAEKNEILNKAIDNAVAIEIEGTRAFVLSDHIHLEFLKKHYEDHMAFEGSQLRLWLDMELISPGSAPPLTKVFLSAPHKSATFRQRKEYYRIHYFALPNYVRFRYLSGDIFPSLKWMRERYNCGNLRALLHYPERIGKLLWLLGGRNFSLV
jgi:hypothetical protein